MLSKQTNIKFGVLAILVGVGTFAMVRQLTRSVRAYAQSQAIPFTLVQSITRESGAEVDRKISARRSDGTLVEIHAAGPPEFGMKVRSVLASDGAGIALYDTFRMKTTWPARQVEKQQQVNLNPATCVTRGNKLISHDQIFGVDVEVIETESEALHMISYNAPKLACMTVQYKVLAGPKDKASGTPISLDVGQEPDPKLFESSNYEEVKPSEVDRRLLIAIGHAEHITDPEHMKSAAEDDAAYDARHKLK